MLKIYYLNQIVFQTCPKQNRQDSSWNAAPADQYTFKDLQRMRLLRHSESISLKPPHCTFLHVSNKPSYKARSEPLSCLFGASLTSFRHVVVKSVHSEFVKSQMLRYYSGCFPSTSHQSITLADSSRYHKQQRLHKFFLIPQILYKTWCRPAGSGQLSVTFLHPEVFPPL